MKLSELSYREFIALEVFSRFNGDRLNADAARHAFLAADAFLAQAGLEHDKLASAERRAEKAEAQVSLLLNMNEDGNFGSRLALMQIWEFLGVRNQTEAMQMLRDLYSGITECLDAERARQADLKPGAPASQYTAKRLEKLEKLLSAHQQVNPS